MSNLLVGSSGHCLTHHSIIGDITFLYCTNMCWSSFIPLSHCLFLYPTTSFRIFIPPLSIPYILIHISDSILSSHHSHISLMVWPFILSLISLSTFPLKLLSPWIMRFSYAIHLVHEGTGLIIGYLSLVSLHFFHPITLAYVTSRVLRPSWGHEIRRYLWQSSLGQAFVDWLKYGRYYVLFYGRYFWKHLVSLLLGILMFDRFLGLETVHWGYWIRPLVVHYIFTLGHILPFPRDSYLLLCGMTILIHGYRDVWLILIDSLLYIRYPYWGILLSPWWDCA